MERAIEESVVKQVDHSVHGVPSAGHDQKHSDHARHVTRPVRQVANHDQVRPDHEKSGEPDAMESLNSRQRLGLEPAHGRTHQHRASGLQQ